MRKTRNKYYKYLFRNTAFERNSKTYLYEKKWLLGFTTWKPFTHFIHFTNFKQSASIFSIGSIFYKFSNSIASSICAFLPNNLNAVKIAPIIQMTAAVIYTIRMP